ncbi:acyltransferase family protein [Brevundimonas faecalis]|uniref:acyltransferase family protein n=1 Tax=Brevundimonas faecalis TaxID=947378 RepID=UPI0036158D15
MTPVQTPNPMPADLRPLTALRFMAALWVALYTFWPNLDVGFVPNLTAKGYLGVELFFVLSGFILSHVYLQAFAEKRFSYRGFLWARIARIYPLHLFTLFGVMALGLAATFVGMQIDSGILSWKTLPAHLLMVHAWGFAGEAGWNHPSWSISAEWFAYLTFPLFATLAWSLRKRPWLAAGAAALFLAGLYAGFERVAGFPLTEATFRWGALRIVPCFAYGCALYLVYRRAPLPRAGLLALAAAAVMIAAASIFAWDAVTVLAAGLLILALASVPNERAGLLASRPAVYLGEISYSVYMVCAPWQILAVNLAARATGAEDKRLQLFVWLGIVLGLIAAAAVTYHLVERPARKALRGWAERRRAPVDHGTKQSETVLQPSDTIV